MEGKDARTIGPWWLDPETELEATEEGDDGALLATLDLLGLTGYSGGGIALIPRASSCSPALSEIDGR